MNKRRFQIEALEERIAPVAPGMLLAPSSESFGASGGGGTQGGAASPPAFSPPPLPSVHDGAIHVPPTEHVLPPAPPTCPPASCDWTNLWKAKLCSVKTGFHLKIGAGLCS